VLSNEVKVKVNVDLYTAVSWTHLTLCQASWRLFYIVLLGVIYVKAVEDRPVLFTTDMLLLGLVMIKIILIVDFLEIND